MHLKGQAPAQAQETSLGTGRAHIAAVVALPDQAHGARQGEVELIGTRQHFGAQERVDRAANGHAAGASGAGHDAAVADEHVGAAHGNLAAAADFVGSARGRLAVERYRGGALGDGLHALVVLAAITNNNCSSPEVKYIPASWGEANQSDFVLYVNALYQHIQTIF